MILVKRSWVLQRFSVGGLQSHRDIAYGQFDFLSAASVGDFVNFND